MGTAKFDYDLSVIGLGPAGMAASIMAAEMGLTVCAVEKHHLGGECVNVGCIPSKALLSMAKARATFDHLSEWELATTPRPLVLKPLQRIQEYISYINDKKTSKLFEKVDLILNRGAARFEDAHTIEAGSQRFRARRIFIATGSTPFIPEVPGLKNVPYLTNATIFSLEKIPHTMTIIGGGAIGCELAQAFTRLGTKCSIINMDKQLIPRGDPEAAAMLQRTFIQEGIAVYNDHHASKVEQQDGTIVVSTYEGASIAGEQLLIAAGRAPHTDDLNLEKAGVTVNEKGIVVNNYLQTSQPHIYAVGDCNGEILFTHAAMHQGMTALMNCLMPCWPFKQNFRTFAVPWTVFTEPEISAAGMTERELQYKKIEYDAIVAPYEDYGAAISQNIATGYVKVFTDETGKIFGVSIVGANSGEMINEWALAIQKKIRLHEIMMTQHSFPTMGFLTKRVSEQWLAHKIKLEGLHKKFQFLYRLWPAKAKPVEKQN